MAEGIQQNYENDFNIGPESMETDEGIESTECKQLRKFQSENEQLNIKVAELEERLRQEMMKNKAVTEETYSDGHTEQYVVVHRPDQERENLRQQLEELSSRLRQKEEEKKNFQAQIEELTQRNESLQAEFDRLQAKNLEGLEQRLRQKEEEIKNLQTQIEELTLRNESLQADFDRSQAQNLEGSEQRLRQKEEEIKNLQAQIEELTQRNESLQADFHRLQAQNLKGFEQSLQAQIEELTLRNESLQAEFDRLQAQNLEGLEQSFQTHVEELTQRNQSLQAEVERLSSQLQNIEGSEQMLQAEKQSLTENIRKLENERDCAFAKSLQENDTWIQRVEQLNNEICSLQAREAELTKQIYELTVNDNAKAEALSFMAKQKQTIQNKLGQCEKENTDLMKKLEQMKLKMKSKEDEIKNMQEAARIDAIETKKEHQALQRQIAQLNTGKTEAEKQKCQKENIIRQLDETIRQLHDNYRAEINHCHKNLLECRKRIESLEQEKKDLTLRLSRLAGANLTYNNPNIADLSDENRPTKLAEEFSELYDYEWTDAFEALAVEDEREKTQVMLNILKNANRLCRNATKDHTDAVRNGFITLNVRSDLEVMKTPTAALKENQDSSETTKTSADTEEMQVGDKEAQGEKTPPKTSDEETTVGDNKLDKQNETDAHAMEVEQTQASDNSLNGKASASESADPSQSMAEANKHLPETGGLRHEENEEHQGETTVSADNDHTEHGEGELSAADTNRQTTGNSKPIPTVNDVNSAKDINDDPAGTRKEEQITHQKKNHFNNLFDKEADRDKHSAQGTTIACYTSLTANFDDLTNEQKKTLSDIRRFFEDKLSKLFCQESTKIVTKSLPDNIKNEESLQKYIQKCLQLCWSMSRHEPPVFIHFIEPGSDTTFNTNLYKPYTKTGKCVDYIVWPALYLHDGGPMLAKGVAQGQK